MRKADRSVALAAVMAVAGLASAAYAIPAVDGTRDAEYGTPLAVQTVQTQFGNNQSELDALYANITGGKLHLFFAGNQESNYNKLVVFFDTKSGGQNTILQSSPIQDNYTGMKFDAGFSADYSMILNRGDGDNSYYADFSELPTAGGGFGGYAGKVMIPGPSSGLPQQGGGFLTEGAPGMPSIELGYNDANTGGVSGGDQAGDQEAAAAVTTGTEFSFDLTSLGITGDFKVMAFINGSGHDFASNQFLPGLPAPQGNLGNNGAGGLSNVDLTAFAGDQFVNIPYSASVNSWAVAGGGSWNSGANWSLGAVPNGTTAQAVLSGPAGAGTRVITLDADVTVQRLTFDNATAGYNVSSPGTLTVNASPLLPALAVLAGNHTISAPVTLLNNTRVEVAAGTSLALTGAVTASNQDLFVSGGGSFTMPATSLNSYTVNSGTLKLTGSNNAVVRGATVDAGATLDLTSSALVVDYDEGSSPRDTLKAAAVAGQLVSSTRTGSAYAIGYLDSAADPSLVAYGDTPLDSTALVFRATLKGDTDLSLLVDFDDLVTVAQNYGGTDKQWFQGDSDHDGDVDFDDLVPLAQNYSRSAVNGSLDAFGASFNEDWALAQSLAPEPMSLSVLFATGMLLKRRRN